MSDPGDLKVGAMFVYTTPAGREIIHTVDALDAETPQGTIMPRTRRTDGDVIYLHDELLSMDWWQPMKRAADA